MEPMRAVLAAKFWNDEVESTRSLDALVYSVPHEPPAMGLVRGSKVWRSQQLLLLQKLFRVPFTPSVEPPNAVNGNCGGIVLDRVIASVGGENWWTTITTRARAQQFWFLEKQRRERNEEGRRSRSEREGENWWHIGQRMLNSSLYAMSMQSHFQLGTHTVLSANSWVDSVQGLLPGRRTEQNLPGESERRGPEIPWHGRVSLRHKTPGHDWILESARRGHFVDREARYWEVPQVTTLDLSSIGTKRGGLRYRVGMHHSSGDPVECPKDDGNVMGEVPVGARPGVRAQAALSVEKDIHLWEKGDKKRKERRPYNLLAAHPHVTLSGIAGGLVGAQLHTERREQEESSTTERRGPVSADIFTSVGMTAQFGQFQRLLLDHTKLGARLDIAAASFLQGVIRNAESRRPHYDTNDVSVNNVLPVVSFSFEQQLVGPFCARVDSRFRLDPANYMSWPSNLQDMTYGVDCSLEKIGAAKVVVWYSPTRQEGMAELRIFER